MAKYTGISDTSKAIINILKVGCSKENIISPEGIGACDPGERENFIIGIHPYDIIENNEMRSNGAIPMVDGDLRNPPTSVRMLMMISVVSKAESSIKSLDEQRILGKVIQLLTDTPRIPKEFMPESLRNCNEDIMISMLNMNIDEKVKIWSMFSQPYKLSCFYDVGPILIESEIIKKASPRVKSVYLDSQVKSRAK